MSFRCGSYVYLQVATGRARGSFRSACRRHSLCCGHCNVQVLNGWKTHSLRCPIPGHCDAVWPDVRDRAHRRVEFSRTGSRIYREHDWKRCVCRVCAGRHHRCVSPSFARSPRRLRERRRRRRDGDQQTTSNSRPAPVDRNVCRDSPIERGGHSDARHRK